jgi:hypothetical protein
VPNLSRDSGDTVNIGSCAGDISSDEVHPQEGGTDEKSIGPDELPAVAGRRKAPVVLSPGRLRTTEARGGHPPKEPYNPSCRGPAEGVNS